VFVISIERLYRAGSFFLVIVVFLVVLAGPSSPAVHADGGAPQLAYVSGTTQGISIITIARQQVTGTIAVGGSPQDVLLSPDGATLYVTQPASGRVEILAARTGKVRCALTLPGQPSLLALSLDATVLYAAGQGDTRVRALNPTTCAVLHTFETHQPVYGLAVAASTAPDATPSTPNQLWITGATALTVFATQGQLLGTVPVPGGPQNISIPAGFTAYVTTRQGTLVAIDLYTRKVFRTLLSGGNFGTMDYDATTGEVYVPDQQNKRLDVLVPVTAGTAGTSSEPVRTFALTAPPQSVAITSDGQLGFVALANGQVEMLDLPGHTLSTTISVGGTPRFIITGLYPPADSPAQSVPQTPNPSLPSLPVVLLLLVAFFALAGIVVLVIFWVLKKRKQTSP